VVHVVISELKYCKNLTEINYYYYYTEKAVEFHSFLPSVLEGVYLQAPAALLPGKETLFPINKRLGRSLSVRIFGRKEKFSCLYRDSNSGASKPVAQ